MSLQDRLSQELRAAMLAKDAERLGTLRLLKSAAGYLQIEKKVEQLSDPDFVSLTQREIKKRRDSIEQYEKAGRTELAEKEKREITVLESFLPTALTPVELEDLVKSTIAELGATSRKQMGAVVKAVQGKAAGKADGKSISELAGRLLS